MAWADGVQRGDEGTGRGWGDLGRDGERGGEGEPVLARDETESRRGKERKKEREREREKERDRETDRQRERERERERE